MDQFYPTIRVIKPNKQPCKWTLLDKFTDGSCSDIYNVISDTNTSGDKYILKYLLDDDNIGISDNIDEWISYITREVTNHDTCFDLGIAPEIVEAWLCKTGGVIIMKKLDITLTDMLKLKEYKTFESHQYIVHEILKLIHTMQQNNIWHDDTHGNNFMIQTKPGNRLETCKFYVIDFGASKCQKPTDSYYEYISLITSLIYDMPVDHVRRIFEPLRLLPTKKLNHVLSSRDRLDKILNH